ncbi:TPA: phosphotransferase [Klebsiella pneumoniae]|uniref:phosphotransferase n=1 Tax=Klebsiella TaxID=570 RepID=UPI000E2BC465|nr:phosphotransferase [Klebsiella pneumoniae]MBL0835040.1 phosphotransferase [Klebsiella pneumoniae]MCE0171900.1 phosphotransferase [Klebsiella pneumoniae]MCE0203661.1 phosphotransferase [Klebsiella pneumoniae]SYG02318.1 homoserine kinase [Klebsiella pneumoniae]HBR2991913.1 phosphotransferase [Klebsiella pneumoniae]
MADNISLEAEATNALTAQQSDIGCDFAADVLSKYYGIRGEVRRLRSERDQNFLVLSKDGTKFTIKFAHPGEERMVSNFQTELMHHINLRAPDLPIQQVRAAVNGEFELFIDCLGQMRMVRVVTYLEGMLMAQSPASDVQKFNLGSMAAHVTNALMDFSHPAQDHVLLWDAQHASLLRDYMNAVVAPARRAMLAFCLDNFEARVKPLLPSLRKSVVHNDMNGDNVLVNPQNTDEIAAILDFGDSVNTAIAIDAAVGATYQMGTGEHLLDGALAYLRGYVAQVPLQEEEINIMFDLFLIRMFVRIVITEWRARQFPENREYILRNTSTSWSQLEQLLSRPFDETRYLIESACKE